MGDGKCSILGYSLIYSCTPALYCLAGTEHTGGVGMISMTGDKKSSIVLYVCSQCKASFDEFEFDRKSFDKDGRILCGLCRYALGLQYIRGAKTKKIYSMAGKTGKEKTCILCGERIKKGSREVRYRVHRGKREYLHNDCPVERQGNLGV